MLVQFLFYREPELTPEERDLRTVFCMQLSARIKPRDLEEFFSSVGKVKKIICLIQRSQIFKLALLGNKRLDVEIKPIYK